MGPWAREAAGNLWEFPKVGDTLFWCPYDEDPTIQGTKLGSPIFGNPLVGMRI